MTRTLLDTGPIVAFYDKNDRWHNWVFEQMRLLQPPLLTCEPVLTETCFLLGRGTGNPRVVLQAVRMGILQVDFDLPSQASSLENLMERYADTPMSLADACIVRLAELQPDCRVFTLDRDFSRYRRHGRQIIPLLAPW